MITQKLKKKYREAANIKEYYITLTNLPKNHHSKIHND